MNGESMKAKGLAPFSHLLVPVRACSIKLALESHGVSLALKNPRSETAHRHMPSSKTPASDWEEVF